MAVSAYVVITVSFPWWVSQLKVLITHVNDGDISQHAQAFVSQLLHQSLVWTAVQHSMCSTDSVSCPKKQTSSFLLASGARSRL